jgi:hypothetical protein
MLQICCQLLGNEWTEKAPQLQCYGRSAVQQNQSKHLPLQFWKLAVAIPYVVQPSGHEMHEIADESVVLTNPSRYRPLGQSRTTLSSQKRPGGTTAGQRCRDNSRQQQQ